MKGYKVCNYDKWTSIPDIFPTLKNAKKAKEEWEYGKNAVIEYFNSKNNKVKRFFNKER